MQRLRWARPSPATMIAVGAASVMLAVSARYGYHRDELYFLASGRHLAWGYPDQPPLVPFLAHVAAEVAPRSLVVLRLLSDLAVGIGVAVAALLARELGGDRTAQTVAAAVTALGSVLLGSGHLLSTTTFALLAEAVLLLLIVRIVRGGDERLWVVAGVVAGLGLLDNDLLLLLVGSLVLALVLVGPRDVLRSPWLWLGALVALAMWSPYLDWQARHGWPQLTVARAIAHGSSGTSMPRWQVVVFQLVVVSPWLVAVWVAGLVRLWRDPAVRRFRFIAVGYVVLLAGVVLSGGKGYYVAGIYPALVAAGAVPTVAWVRRRRRPRRVLFGAALVLAAIGLPIVLPLLPVDTLHATPVVAVNYDAGETVGWPVFVAEIAAAYDRAAATGPTPTLVASNYGEAGAVDRYGTRYRLPPAYSGDNGYYTWGPPPGRPGRIVAVGFSRGFLAARCGGLRLLTRLDNHHNVDDDEQGAPVWSCTARDSSWSTLWPRFRFLG